MIAVFMLRYRDFQASIDLSGVAGQLGFAELAAAPRILDRLTHEHENGAQDLLTSRTIAEFRTHRV
jgi:hypothetical protein